ncbi:MAG TPA: hypothetical protein VOA41_03905, partial [Candidatus Dormibacteraeota bacterium]|nr:hypothetical protein [Candidatus Dormibacteraeota bacterium]
VKGQFLFRVTGAGREFLLKEGTDLKYGARHLKRAIERHVVYPLANLLATDQVRLGDLLCIDLEQSRGRLAFHREGEGVLVPVKRPEPVIGARGAQAKGGRPLEMPATAAALETSVPANPGQRLLR